MSQRPSPQRACRPSDARTNRLRNEGRPDDRAGPSRAVGRALAYASRGWPVFPCQPGSKEPATRHGFHDATTDPDQIRSWWQRQPDANLAIATGVPGPDVLDVDQHGQAGSGYAALSRLKRAGLLDGAGAIVRHAARRPAPLLHRQRPAVRAAAASAPGLPGRRRVRPRPAVPGRRQALPPRPPAVPVRRPGLGRGDRPAGAAAGPAARPVARGQPAT